MHFAKIVEYDNHQIVMTVERDPMDSPGVYFCTVLTVIDGKSYGNSMKLAFDGEPSHDTVIANWNEEGAVEFYRLVRDRIAEEEEDVSN